MKEIIKSLILVWWMGAVLWSAGCTRSSQLNPQAPALGNMAPARFTPQLSTITVPVTFRIHTLEDKLNQQFTGVLYNDENLEDDNLKVRVHKSGNLRIQAENNKLYLAVPLHIAATGRWMWEACKICPKLQKTESTAFDIVVKSESQLTFTEDYQVKSVSTSNFEWGESKPVLALGPLRIGLARFIEPALQDQMQTLAAQLDREIQKRITIKEYAQQAWLQVQRPILLDKNLNAWLTISPQGIRVSPLVARNGELHLQIGLSSYLQTVTNGKPAVTPNPQLPKLLTDNQLTNEVQISLVSEISYQHATRLLHQQVVNQTFSLNGSQDKLTLHDIALSGSADKLVVMLDVTGTARTGFFRKNITGKLFLKGQPYYDTATASIRVRELDYDLDTKDQLLKTASWLAKNKFIHQLEDLIKIPVKTQLDDARRLLQQNLDQAAQTNGALLLQGNITEVVPDAIYLTPTAIKAVVNARGQLTAQITKF